mmetsp:Transcript_17967/g.38341  ORF Transcript_17967/g.38341 Transcript_17967/m.38341 type:complete len:194 (+) Transcript_17967:62-643(+)
MLAMKSIATAAPLCHATLRRCAGLAAQPQNCGRPIWVKLQTDSGLGLELAMKPEKTVRDLKLKVAKIWHVPTAFQTLVLQGAILDGPMPLAQLPSRHSDLDGFATSPVPVTLVPTLGKVYRSLSEPGAASREARLEALQVAVQLAMRLGDSRATAAVSACAEDLDPEVRRAGLQAMAEMAQLTDASKVSRLIA